MTPSLSARHSPFQGLQPFTEATSHLFFGRDTETRIIEANLRVARVTVMHGPSGVGKTSIIRAGVIPRLREASPVEPGAFAIAFVRASASQNMIVEVEHAVQAAVRQSSEVELEFEPGAIDEGIRNWMVKTGNQVLLIIDQFEALAGQSSAQRDDFGWLLARLVSHPKLPVNTLLAIRSEFMFILDQFAKDTPHIFANLVSLDYLDQPSAVAAIVGPIRVSGEPVRFDDSVVHPILEAAMVSDQDGARFDPVLLENLMTLLWEAGERSGTMNQSILAELGGPKHILQSYVMRSLARLDFKHQEIAAIVFRYLVTPTGAITDLSAEDLRAYSGFSPESVDRVLQSLVYSRLLRIESRNGEVVYRIGHQSLVGPIRCFQQNLERNKKRKRSLVLALVVVGLFLLAWVVFASIKRSGL